MPGAAAAAEEEKAGEAIPLVGEERVLYPQLVGRLQYLAGDQPDIQYSVKELGRDLAQPTQASAMRLKRVLRYLAVSKQLVHRVELDHMLNELSVFTDRNWANCPRTRKSTSSIHVLLDKTLVRASVAPRL